MGTVMARKKNLSQKGKGLDGVHGSLMQSIAVALILISILLLLPRVLLASPGYIFNFAGGGDGNAATSSSVIGLGVSLDSAGNIYIADDTRIRKVNASGAITTVAGNGIAGNSGDNGPALSASLHGAVSVAIDSTGNIYIADVYNQRIRKVDTNGVITTVAGNGSAGYSGDNGPATSASLSYPWGIAVDLAGNVYIADESNSRIRRVDTNGEITTVAGNGTHGYSGDNGPATSATLGDPLDVAVDASGNIYIADDLNDRIRKVDTSGVITTVAGNGSYGYSGDNGPAISASLWGPEGITIDSTGNMYIVDRFNNRIRKVDTNGVITTVAGNGIAGYSGDNGPATSASMSYPQGIAVDLAGNVYIADDSNRRIRKVDTNGVITTVAGNGFSSYSGDNGPAMSASLASPEGVATDSTGNVYLSDTSNKRIRKVDTNGLITTVAGGGNGGGGDNGPATEAHLGRPTGVTVDATGNIYISDVLSSVIRKVDTNGVITTAVGFGSEGGYFGDGGPATLAAVRSPNGMTVDSAGNLYIADSGNSRIRKVDTSGVITTVAGNGTIGYSGDNGPAMSASLADPRGVAIDSAGNLYISDRGNSRIRKVDTSGVITTVAGNGTIGYSGDNGPAMSASLAAPQGVAIDSAGNIYLSDSSNNCIRKVDTSGVITTVAGNGTIGYSGDNGPATSASLYGPYGIAVDLAGNMYIADKFNSRIRKVVDMTVAPVTTGTNVSVALSPQIDITFSDVTSGGSVTAITVLPGGLPAPPPNFTLLGGTSSYDITTDAGFNGDVQICIVYDPAKITVAEQLLRLFHYSGGTWTDITLLPVDTVNKKVCGLTSSFSIFAVAAPTYTPEALSLRYAAVQFWNKQDTMGSVLLWADFNAPKPAADDVITGTFDKITLFSAPFSEFKRGFLPNVYWYVKNGYDVRIDITHGQIIVITPKITLTGIDNSNGVDVQFTISGSDGMKKGFQNITMMPAPWNRLVYRRQGIIGDPM